MAEEYVTRAVVFQLDLSRPQERLAYSYAGARRFAYNWAIGAVLANLVTRSAERAAGMAESDLTPALSWSAYSLNKAFNSAKGEIAPWWREVSMHAFRSGVTDAAAALANFSDSKRGLRAGKRVGFPRFKSRNRSTPTVSFVEINHQLSWLHPDRHHIRLMLPQNSPDADVRRRSANLVWLHTTESTRRLYNLLEQERARIQKATISFRGGRWQVSFTVRYLVGLPARKPLAQSARLSGIVGLDVGLTHLATLDRAVPGLVHCFDAVAIEDLGVAAMSSHKHHLGRSMADASLGELRRQLTYKSDDRGTALVVIDRFYPSSKTCSCCGAVRAKLLLSTRVFECESCGASLDRDLNAARNIAREGARILSEQRSDQQYVAGLRPETQNADPRSQKTSGAHAPMAAVA